MTIAAHHYPDLANAGLAKADSADAASARRAVAPSSGAGAVRPSIRNGTVLIYIGLAILCLVPGLVAMAKVPIAGDTPLGAHFQRLTGALRDIRFGGGLRFWLGVSGATMMALMLLYPLRKVFARGRRLGSVGGWFHVHILMGLFGPVLILYHCNFGHGALNANVALWSMLVVAVSGIVGHFVYARVSAGFYGGKRQARDLLDALIVALRALGARHPAHLGLIDRLERFEARMLAPRGGIYASIAARLRSAVYRHHFHRDLAWILANCGREQGWSQAQKIQRGHHLHSAMSRYMDCVTAATGRSVLEQLWARWRLFHLPVFLIMLVAIVAHVAAVWGMDTRPASPSAAAVQSPAAIASVPAPATPNRSSVEIEGHAATDGSVADEAAAPRIVAPAAPVLLVKPHEITELPSAASSPARIDQPMPTDRPPARVAAQATSQPVREADRPAMAVAVAAKSPPVPKTSAPASVSAPQMAREPVATKEREASAGVPSASPASAPAPSIEATYSALRQRLEQPPMGLGASKRVLSLEDRIAELKAQKFDHSRTQFPLIGKHARVDCSDCHTKTLENNPRECVACHKQDDPHRGRRPDCAKCHTPTSWGQIIRR